jgi:3-hydroxybutyrate dehydrogenase
MQEPDLRGRCALVTGANRGIGRATALQLARRGARLIVTGRNQAELDAVASEITSLGAETQPLSADIAERSQVESLVERAGPVDILVNNAGTLEPISPTVSADPDTWHRNLMINLFGPFLLCKFALPGMMERGWGHIINVSSGAAGGRTTSWGAYSSSKAGLEAFTRVLARESDGTGVQVNAVRPGIVDTGMQAELRRSTEERFGRDNLERFRSYKERGMLRSPEDPARLILWLLSTEAEGTNGEVLAIDDPEVAARIGVTPQSR